MPYVHASGHITQCKKLESGKIYISFKESVYNSRKEGESKYETYYYALFLDPSSARDKFALSKLLADPKGMPITVHGNMTDEIRKDAISRTFSFPTVIIGVMDEWKGKGESTERTERTAPVSRPKPEPEAEVPSDYDPFADDDVEEAAPEPPKQKAKPSSWGK